MSVTLWVFLETAALTVWGLVIIQRNRKANRRPSPIRIPVETEQERIRRLRR